MEQQHKELTAAASASSPATASSGSSPSSSPSIHASTASAALGVSSSSSTHSFQSQQRRSSPSLYPPPRPPLSGSGHLASRGPAATSAGSSASRSSPSSSQSRLLHRISPSPWAAGKRRSRPHARVTHSLPTPFLSELSSIRRTGASSAFGDLNAQEMTMTPRRPLLLHGQQQQQEMTRPSSLSSSTVPLQQQQAQPSSSFSTLQPLPGSGGNFNFSGFPLLPAPQQMQMQPPSSSSSTDLSSSIFSGLALLPQPTPSDSVLPPLPPSLEIPQQLSPNNGGSSIVEQSTSGFMQPSSDSKTYELAPLPESLQMPVAVAPEPESISLDDGNVDELTALANSFIASSSHGHGHGSASLPNHMHEQQPTSLDLESMQGQQMGSSSSEPRMMMRGAATANGVGVGQTKEAMPTPPASVRGKVSSGGGSSSSSIPWNCHASMPLYSVSRSEEQALRQLSELLAKWSSDAGSSSGDQTMGSSVTGSCAAMPELANKFGMMSIGGSSSSAGTKMPSNCRSLPENSTTPVPAVPRLLLGGIHGYALPPWPPATGAGASSSVSRSGGAKEHNFSEADMETINKDSRLKELLETDSKRLKRLLRYRDYAARQKEQKENNLQDLEDRVDALSVECSSLSTQVQSEKETMANLKTKSREMEIKFEGLQEQDRLSQNLNNQLHSEIERLKHELNML